MNIKVCDEICKTCPWREENGHQLISDTIAEMVQSGRISPCHQKLEEITGSRFEGVEEYAKEVEEFQVCRGFVASMVRNNFAPPNNAWNYLYMLYLNSDIQGEPDVVNVREVINGNIGH